MSSGFLLDYYPALLTARYGFATNGIDAFAVIEAIAGKRSGIPKGHGGKLDIGKAASTLLIDYRNGAPGRISLETPELRTAWGRELTQTGAVDGWGRQKNKISKCSILILLWKPLHKRVCPMPASSSILRV
jgi:hypothetical protein